MLLRVTVPSFAPPGCKKETLGINVYPLPEFVISTLVTCPFVTTAFNSAWTEPELVGDWITTVGGLVSL